MHKVLVIDDDANFGLILKNFLGKNNFDVTFAYNAKDGIEAYRPGVFQVVLTDFRLPDGSGLDILKQIKEKEYELPVILMTSYGDIRSAVNAVKLGAFDYLAKPINPDELLLTIHRALDAEGKADESPRRKNIKVSKGLNSFEFLKGKSPAAMEMQAHLSLVAPTDMSVIIQGESGTGKEYFSRLIHEESKRKDNPFVAIDCGALSPELAASEFFGHIKGSFTGAIDNKIGQFEYANGGTLFLDEVGNLSYENQVKLLRALQERKIRKIGDNKDIEVDVRIISATNEDLIAAVKRGDFREDLYHRLNEFKIEVRPLRERGEDIEMFATHFLQLANEELGKAIERFSEEVNHIFLRYSWPGNVREMKNVVKRAVLLSSGNEVIKSTLPPEIIREVENPMQEGIVTETKDLKALAEKNEKDLIQKTLEEVKFNKSKAAKILNIDRSTLYNKIKLYGLE
jgi:two-component system, NtrC family, response regulator HydG